MKSPLLLLCLFLCFSSFSVFSQAYESTVTYDKKKQPAVAIDYSYPSEAVENAFVQKMEKMGNKAKEEKGLFNKDKGFIVFKNASVPEISDKRLNYMVKVERKSKKEKDESNLSLIINDENGASVSESDAEAIDRAKAFLNELLPEIEAANLDLQIKAQEEAVAKAEKKLKDLKDSQENMEKKIKDLESDLKKNANEQEKQQAEIEKQKEILGILKGKKGT
jgi:hypothetical protein